MAAERRDEAAGGRLLEPARPKGGRGLGQFSPLRASDISAHDKVPLFSACGLFNVRPDIDHNFKRGRGEHSPERDGEPRSRRNISCPACAAPCAGRAKSGSAAQGPELREEKAGSPSRERSQEPGVRLTIFSAPEHIESHRKRGSGEFNPYNRSSSRSAPGARSRSTDRVDGLKSMKCFGWSPNSLEMVERRGSGDFSPTRLSGQDSRDKNHDRRLVGRLTSVKHGFADIELAPRLAGGACSPGRGHSARPPQVGAIAMPRDPAPREPRLVRVPSLFPEPGDQTPPPQPGSVAADPGFPSAMGQQRRGSRSGAGEQRGSCSGGLGSAGAGRSTCRRKLVNVAESPPRAWEEEPADEAVPDLHPLAHLVLPAKRGYVQQETPDGSGHHQMSFASEAQHVAMEGSGHHQNWMSLASEAQQVAMEIVAKEERKAAIQKEIVALQEAIRTLDVSPRASQELLRKHAAVISGSGGVTPPQREREDVDTVPDNLEAGLPTPRSQGSVPVAARSLASVARKERERCVSLWPGPDGRLASVPPLRHYPSGHSPNLAAAATAPGQPQGRRPRRLAGQELRAAPQPAPSDWACRAGPSASGAGSFTSSATASVGCASGASTPTLLDASFRRRSADRGLFNSSSASTRVQSPLATPSAASPRTPTRGILKESPPGTPSASSRGALEAQHPGRYLSGNRSSGDLLGQRRGPSLGGSLASSVAGSALSFGPVRGAGPSVHHTLERAPSRVTFDLKGSAACELSLMDD